MSEEEIDKIKEYQRKKYQELARDKKEPLKNKCLFFSRMKRMSEKTLKFHKIRVNKKEFRKPKQPVDLMSVNVDQIVVPKKLKHSDEDFKYFIGYQEGEIVKPLYIILPQ